jgi:hypothetical protein
MKLHNKWAIKLVMLLGAVFVLYVSGKDLKKYFSFKFNGIHVSGKVIDHKRINGHGGLQPYIQFLTKDNATVATNAKIALPSFLKVRGKYYAVNDKVSIAYEASNPKNAVILSYTSWAMHVLGLLFGVLILYIALQRNK